MAVTAIDLHEVTKIYRKGVAALRGIEMRVSPGEVFGLLGPNGAGKSTLVKIMMTVVHPTRCRGTVLGAPLGHKPTLARIGYLPENHRFPRYLTGRRVLHFFAALAKVKRPLIARRADELLELVGMSAYADRPVSEYSKGMAQRIGLAHALMNDPDLILLDEPTDGVDPVGRRDIRNVLLQLRQRGKTVFINSHQLSELDALCDRVAILVGGEVRRQGGVAELAMAGQRYEIEIEPTTPQQDMKALSMATSKIAANAGNSEPIRWEVFAPLLRIMTQDAGVIQPVLDDLRQAGCVIRRVQAVKPNLEELFFNTVGATQPLPAPPLSVPPLPAEPSGGKV